MHQNWIPVTFNANIEYQIFRNPPQEATDKWNKYSAFGKSLWTLATVRAQRLYERTE